MAYNKDLSNAKEKEKTNQCFVENHPDKNGLILNNYFKLKKNIKLNTSEIFNDEMENNIPEKRFERDFEDSTFSSSSALIKNEKRNVLMIAGSDVETNEDSPLFKKAKIRELFCEKKDLSSKNSITEVGYHDDTKSDSSADTDTSLVQNLRSKLKECKNDGHIKDQKQNDDDGINEEEENMVIEKETPGHQDCNAGGDVPDNYIERIKIFTEEQKTAYNYIVKLLQDGYDDNHNLVLINGAAGTGKTMLVKTLCDFTNNYLKEQSMYTAATGVVALQYPTGRTAHSVFGLPFSDSDELCVRHDIKDYQNQVSEASLIVIDDFQMINIEHLTLIDQQLQKLMGVDDNFGGKVIVLVSDFWQVPPIVPNSSDPVDFSPRPINYNYKFFELSTPCRTGKDIGYLDFLKEIALNKLPKIMISFRECVPLKDFNYETNMNNFIEFVFPTEILLEDPEECSKRVILTPINEKALTINQIIASRIPTTRTFTSKDVINDVQDNYLDRVIPDRELTLWEGALCMVIRTIYEQDILLVGSRVIVEKIDPDYNILLVRKPGDKQLMLIKRETFVEQRLTREQFPLMLCYATTIHKSQGQTFEKAGVDLTHPVFRHGQLYLALSRVRRRKDMIVLVEESHLKDGVPYACNISDPRLVRHFDN